jgi:hypothetical protein
MLLLPLLLMLLQCVLCREGRITYYRYCRLLSLLSVELPYGSAGAVGCCGSWRQICFTIWPARVGGDAWLGGVNGLTCDHNMRAPRPRAAPAVAAVAAAAVAVAVRALRPRAALSSHPRLAQEPGHVSPVELAGPAHRPRSAALHGCASVLRICSKAASHVSRISRMETTEHLERQRPFPASGPARHGATSLQTASGSAGSEEAH